MLALEYTYCGCEGSYTCKEIIAKSYLGQEKSCLCFFLNFSWQVYKWINKSWIQILKTNLKLDNNLEKIFANDTTDKGLISKYTNRQCSSILKKIGNRSK